MKKVGTWLMIWSVSAVMAFAAEGWKRPARVLKSPPKNRMTLSKIFRPPTQMTQKDFSPVLADEEALKAKEARTGNFKEGSFVDSRIAPPSRQHISQTIFFFEDFEAGLPADWTVVDGNGDGASWVVGTTSDLFSYQPPNYGTQYAFYSDDDAGSGAPAGNEDLISPPVDISGASSLYLRYDLGFNIIDVNNETTAVMVRFFSGGAWGPWTEIAFYQQDIATSDTFDLSAFLPADSVQFMDHYVDADGGWYWATAIDNVTFYGSSPILFFEDFEAGLPADWTVVDGNGDGASWVVGTTSDLGNYEPPNYGTQYAYYSDDDAGFSAPPGNEDLISPAVDVSGISSLFVRYDWGFNIYGFTAETLAFRVRFFSGGAWGDWQQLVAYLGSTGIDTSGTDTFDLSGFLPADSVQFEAHYVDPAGDWSWAVGVDNVTFFSPPTPPYVDGDAGVASAPNSALPDTLATPLIHPDVVVANNGNPDTGPPLTFRVFYKVMHEGIIIYNSFYDVFNLPAGESDTVYFSPDLVFPGPGEYTVIVTIQLASDPNPDNNTSSRTFYVPAGVVLLDNQETNSSLVFSFRGPQPSVMAHQTTFEFQLPAESPVTLKIYDASGRTVRTLVSRVFSPGYYRVTWRGRDDAGNRLKQGVYFYRFLAGEHHSSGQILLVR